MTSKLNWNERFALIDHYKPSDDQIRAAFGVTAAEYATAKSLRQTGTIVASKDIDVSKYADMFVAPSTGETVTTTKKASAKSETKTTTTTKAVPAESATKRVVTAKKRGRKGTKISEAFKAIPATPVAVEDFARQYGVSVPVLRQSKRFDTSADAGVVRVKVSKETGKLMIWREKTSA